MADVVGSAEVNVSADTTPFLNDMRKLSVETKRLGRLIGENIADPLARRTRIALARVRANFSKAWQTIRTDTIVLSKIVELQMKKIARNIRGVISTALMPFQAAAIQAFTRARERVNDFVALAILPFRAVVTRAIATVRNDFIILREVVSQFATRARNEIVGKFNSAMELARSGVSRLRTGVATGFNIIAQNVSYNMRAARDSVRNWLSNTVVGQITAQATRVGVQLGRTIGSGFNAGFKYTEAALTKGVRAVRDKLGGMVDAKTRAKVSKAASAFGRIFNGPRLRIMLAVDRIKASIRGIDGPMKTLGAKAKLLMKPFESVMKKTAQRISRSWLRMDSTVRAVIISILIAGQPLAAVMAGLSASLVGLAAALAGAAAAGAALIGVLAPLALAFAAAAKGLKDLNTYSTEAYGALQGLKSQFTDVGVPALMEEWSGSLGGFFDSLRGFLSEDLFSGLGQALSGATEGLTEVLSGDVGAAFSEALEGPLTGAFSSIMNALAPLVSALLDFMTAAAPYTKQLADLFLLWAENFAAAFGEMTASPEFTAFMESAVEALVSVFDLLGAVKGVLGTVFAAGIDAGVGFLDMITDLVLQFQEFLNQNPDALTGFFDNIMAVMPPLFDLIGAVGTALADLVTPEVIAGIGDFLGSISDIMPVIGELLAILGQAHIVQLFSAAIQAIGNILTPLAPILGEVVNTIAVYLIQALEQAAPYLEMLGEAMGLLLQALLPLIPPLLEFVFSLLGALLPIIVQLAPKFAELISAIAPLIPQILDALMPVLEPLIDLLITVGEILVDALIPLFDALWPIIEILLNVALIPMVTVLEILNPIMELLGSIIVLVAGWVADLINWIVDWIKENKQVQKAIETISDRLDTMIDWVNDVVDAIQDWLSNVDIGQWFQDAWETIKDWFTDVGNWVTDLWENIRSTFSDIGNAIKDAFVNAFNTVARAWNSTVGSLSWTTPDWIPGIGGKTISAPTLPTFASGGIADQASIFGEAGREAAVPLDRPLSQVNPEVRYLSAIAQGKGTPGGSAITIAEGAIVVSARESNPALVAESVLDRLVAYAR